MTSKWVMVLVCVASLSVARAEEGAPAAPPSANDLEQARLHFKRGNKAFDLQRYLEAAREYEAAYDAKEDPALLFNIGQAYRLGGENQKAVGAYKAFLRRQPDARNREEVEARIVDLQKIVTAERHAQEAPPHGTEGNPPPSSGTTTTSERTRAEVVAPAPPIDPSAGRARRRLGIGLLAAGGAAIVVGATLTGLAYNIASTYSHPSATTAYDPGAASRMRAEQISGGVLLGVGAAAAVGGTIVYLLGRRDARAPRFAFAVAGGAR